MRWKNRRRSRHVDDRRRAGGRSRARTGGLSIVGLVLALGVFYFTGDPRVLLQAFGSAATQASDVSAGSVREPTPAEDERAEFVATVLHDTELVWDQLFRDMGRSYAPTTLVLFAEATETACGFGSAATGPFYCPADRQVYIDLSFFEQLARELGAPGDFAQAYVLAHEVGHHVQNLLGTSTDMRRQQRGLAEAEANELSVRLELQADFYAGVWAHHAQANWSVLEAGDLEEALNAAARIGDDALQRRTGGRVRPDSFTHGTSAQRVRWFREGFETGDPSAGDTFAARDL